MPRRPFGRSLDPLPEEDLGGYLLRLSAHLWIAPAALARQFGLINSDQPKVLRRLLLHRNLAEFAASVRLTPAEAHELTLLEWGSRYQPIKLALATGDSTLQQRHPWLFASTLRHCPVCLAGDGSEIQNRYGGAWRRFWRLPVAFACTKHRLFLAEGCGAEHAMQLGSPMLMPGTSLSGLHPAQCRQSRPQQYGRGSLPCGIRLDCAHDTDQPRPSRNYLQAQKQIVQHLEPATDSRKATLFFADLRLVAILLSHVRPALWRETGLGVHHAVAKDAAAYFGVAKHAAIDGPPHDLMATAVLLTAASQILDSAEQQAELASLVYETVLSGHRLRYLETIWTTYAGSCSPELREALVGASRPYWTRYGREYAQWLNAMLATTQPPPRR